MQPATTSRLRGNRAITFAVLAVAASSFSLLQSLIVPVLSTIQTEFHTSQTTVTWVLTGYLLSASICTPLIGRVGDVVGKTRMLTAALVVLSIGSLAAALAPSIGWLIAARVLQGVGGGVMPLSFGILRDEFQEGMRTAISVIASLLSMGFAAGIVLAGPIVDAFGFRGLFLIPAGVTAVAAVAALVFIPDSPVRSPGRLPLVPALLLTGWLVALLLGVSQGNPRGWGSPTVIGLFAAAALLATTWIWVERRAPVPLIDMQMMQRRGMWTANVVAGCVGFGMFGSFAFLPQLLQTPTEAGYGFSASITESGHLLLPSAVASFLIGFVTAPLVGRLGARLVITAGLLAGGLSFISVSLFHDEKWQLYAATTFQGVGVGLVFSSLAAVVVSSVPASQTGVASGMNNNIRTIGGSLGAAVMAGVITSHNGIGGFPAERGYQVGFFVLGVVTISAAVASVRMPSVHQQDTGGRLVDAADGELSLVPGAGSLPSRSA
jgi:MFS family permease